MKIRNKFQTWFLQEDLNFLLTNRIPRITLTRLMGWWSQLRHPWIVKGSIAVWSWFTDLDLTEAKQQTFDSLHACFTRELKPGLRPIDASPDVMTSPCDCIVGACGEIRDGIVFQAKGFPYSLSSLLSSPELVQRWPQLLEGGAFVTMRLTSSMYHRFHAPCDAHLNHVTYISGDTWNVNPIALSRVRELFCKNERAVLQMQTLQGLQFLLVPVAAVLVASMRFHAVDVLLNLRYRGPNEIHCDVDYIKGQEIGWFEHGSTILMFLPPGFALVEGIENGVRLRMGEALFRKI
ncbi:phosphatidylserine decarboxylase [Limnohabitans sp. MORI2]|uniref:archaetidylserine decarboxylase n=1 Tax=Limnohabitans sp. MORI2 TaxID=1751150 RepID=UPI00237773AF|nr:archaetidylserine decarboxylase [Limnohabitans sp. MORI2]BDU58060.1 phosphatidylserine decarboxylase [Limnohabitans sp. MORI2]